MNDTILTYEERLVNWKKRPLSWSQISSFEYDPEQWYQSYFLNKKPRPTAELLFGSKIGEQIEKDLNFLMPIARQSTMEHEFKAIHKRKLGRRVEQIILTGFADSFGEVTHHQFSYALEEYKTGVKAWDQKRVDEHGQLTMYCYMQYLSQRTAPEKILLRLWWMPTVRVEKGDFSVEVKFVDDIENNIKCFFTKRTMKDILNFGARIDRVLGEMEEFAKNHE